MLRGLAVLALVASFVVVGLAAEGRYAMRHSFKGPFEPDSAISFWEAGAGAKVIAEEFFLFSGVCAHHWQRKTLTGAWCRLVFSLNCRNAVARKRCRK